MTRLLLIGGAGFAKEVGEIAELTGHEVIGYVADSAGVLDVPYLGAVDGLVGLHDRFDHVVVAFGAVDRRTMVRRAQLLNWLEETGAPLKPLVSPRAVVSKGVSLGAGCVIAHGAVLSVDATVGAFAIVNTNAAIGHDAVIGRNSVIAPCAFIGGAATVGDSTLIGPNASVMQGGRVGDHVIVSVGTTVYRPVPDGATVAPPRFQVLGGRPASNPVGS